MSFFPFFLLSNLGFALLGQVLGQRFGNGYEGWMRNNILSRFDMSNTFFALDDRYIRIIEEKKETKTLKINTIVYTLWARSGVIYFLVV